MSGRRVQFAFRVAMIAGLVALTAGCAASGAASGRADRDVTGGVELELYESGDAGAFARYLVERDGRLSFGGGFDAMNGIYRWSGPLTAEEIERLLGLIDAAGWRQTDPASTGKPADRSYTITLRAPGVRRTFTALGDEPSVVEVRDLLATAAQRRYGEFLESLPKPGLQR